MSEIIRKFSECHFGYKTSIGKDELEIKKHEELIPEIYLEKKDGKGTILFFTFPAWYDPFGENTDKELFYDNVTIVFESKGYDLNNIVNRAKENRRGNDTYIYEEINKNHLSIKTNGRYEISHRDFSGVGAFILSKNNKESIVYFAINYSPKRKIFYSIYKNKIEFHTNTTIDRLPITVIKNADRLPCLNDETTSASYSSVIHFKNGKKGVGKLQPSNEKIYIDNSIYTWIMFES